MSIKISNLSKYYNNTKVLNDVNIEIHSKCITSIVGGNGSGKTTLARCLATLLIFEKGEFIKILLIIFHILLSSYVRVVYNVFQ